MHIRKVLCPTDLSINSISGIVCALSLSREHGGEVILFHVTSFPSPPLSSLYEAELFPGRSHVFRPPSVDRLLQQAHARVKAFLLKEELDGSHSRIKVSLGQVTREIVAAALLEKVDLIVIAKRHRGILRRMLSPSISEQVSRSAPCPVLSVCPPQIVRPSEGKQWPGVKRILQGMEA